MLLRKKETMGTVVTFETPCISQDISTDTRYSISQNIKSNSDENPSHL